MERIGGIVHGGLAATGANVLPWLIVAGVLVLAGLIAVVIVAARRRAAAPDAGDDRPAGS